MNFAIKDYYRVEYLESKELKKISKPVSVIIPTYNRSPFDPTTQMGKYNPLKITLDSIMDQKKVEIKEIVVVDGNSKDYTKEVLNKLSKDFEIVYLNEGERKGPSHARNIGIENASSEMIYFTDDDCITAPFSIYGALYNFEKLDKKYKVGAVQLPLYQRSTKPLKIKRIDEIGKMKIDEGIKTGNFDAFPLEYIYEEKFLDPKGKILFPLKIEDMGPIFITKRSLMKKVNGFPEFPWRPYYGEHTELAQNIIDNGYEIFLSPDPKFQTVHVRFGYKDSELIGEDWYDHEVKINDLIKISNNWNEKPTGFRLRAEEWYNTSISSYWAIFYKRSPSGARKFLNRIYRDFVLDNSMETYYKFNNKKKRQEIFSKAVNRAQKILWATKGKF